MNLIGICICALVISVLAVLLKKYNAEYSLILSVCAAVIIFIYVIVYILSLVSSLDKLFARTQLDVNYITVLLKCIGVCFITEFTCDCCKDASQNALSSVVLISGRICVLLTAVPLFEEFLNFTLNLAGGKL